MADEEKKKCHHPACSCMVDKSENYCSAYCKDAGKTTEIACNCGHAGCAIGEGRPVLAGGAGS
jgi:hypothetical protein